MPKKVGKLFVISAPAGTGKTTLAKKVLKAYPDQFVRSISYTTRPARQGEEEGKDYFFVTPEAFLAKKQAGDFIETNQIFDYEYGTDEAQIKNLTIKGKNVILVIDIHGAEALEAKLDVCSIFLMPPSEEELKRRLSGRGSESKESLKKRLDRAHKEIAHACHFDYMVVNGDLEEAYQELLKILVEQTHQTDA